MELQRVVVTGLGALTPIGNTVPDFWQALQQGRSGAQYITRFDTSNFKTKFACEVKNFDPLEHLDRKEARKMDAFSQYALVAAAEAMQDANLPLESLDPYQIGVIWASGIGGITTFEEQFQGFVQNPERPRFNPFFIPKMLINLSGGLIAMKYGLRGLSFSTVSACTASSHAIIDAFNYIRLGKAKAIVAGGSEATVSITGIGGFNAMKALSTHNENPQQASRPFDNNRDGFVLGEGAGALVLEELQHAQERGATIYAELVGSGMTSDAYHMTATHPEGLGLQRAMQDALAEAQVQPQGIDYLNVHATSTPVGDSSEAQAVATVFQDSAQGLHISATKSMTGHLLGAAGAVEAIACIQAIKHNIVPPTINHQERDPNLPENLNLTPNQAVPKEISYAMSNTSGFGGHNAVLIFRDFT